MKDSCDSQTDCRQIGSAAGFMPSEEGLCGVTGVAVFASWWGLKTSLLCRLPSEVPRTRAGSMKDSAAK